MKIAGITGGVGCGKSTILNLLKQDYNAAVILADEVAHELMEPHAACYNQIVKRFGEKILAEDHSIDRKALGRIVFSDAKALEELNEIVHPTVKQEILHRFEQIKKENQVSFIAVEAALLIEAGYKEICDELWYIYANREIRIKRLMDSRGYSEEQCLSIIKNQLSEEVFQKECQRVIDNSGKLSDSKEQLDRIIPLFLA